VKGAKEKQIPRVAQNDNSIESGWAEDFTDDRRGSFDCGASVYDRSPFAQDDIGVCSVAGSLKADG
jgi:hypothetical protein